MPLREARIPPDSKVAAIIRGDEMILPRGDERIRPGDRVVVIGSPHAAQAWGEIVAPGESKIDDVVVFGAGQVGTAVARGLLEQGIERAPRRGVARAGAAIAEELPDARVYSSSGLDSDFLERERIGAAHAAVVAMREDAKNLYAATLAKVHGVRSRSRSSTSPSPARCTSTPAST